MCIYIYIYICRHLHVVRLLCEAKARVNKAMPDGTTALMAAAQMGHAEVRTYRQLRKCSLALRYVRDCNITYYITLYYTNIVY